MTRRITIQALLALSALCLLVPARCSADSVIFSSLDGNINYGTPSQGWCVSGGATSNCGPETTRAIAASFTPGSDFTLTQVELDLGYYSGTNAATVSLVNDAGGLPGSTVLESWSVTSLAAWNTPNPPSSLLVMLPAVGTVSLSDGSQYWLEVEAGGASSDTLDIWATSSLNVYVGTVLSLDGGGTWVSPDTVQPDSSGQLTAFAVFGDDPPPAATPEPGTWLLLVLGMSALAFARFHKRKLAA